MMSYNSCYIFMACMFFNNYFYSMELSQLSHFSYIQVRGCDLCGIKEPTLPLMHITGHDIRVFPVNNDSNYTKTVCVHSCMGPTPALSNFCEKKEEKMSYV